MCGVSPPRWEIQRRTGDGIHRIQHLGGFGIGDRAAVGAEIPRRVETEIGVRGHANLVMGTAPSTMVQAEAHRPSMMTCSPEVRRS